MVSEIEEQFYKTFDIPKHFSMEVNFGDLDCNFQTVTEKSLKKLWDNYEFDLGCSEYWFEDDKKAPKTFEEFKKSDFWREEHPKITDEILLKLICLLNDKLNEITLHNCKNIKNLKKYILEECIIEKDILAKDIRKIVRIKN